MGPLSARDRTAPAWWTSSRCRLWYRFEAVAAEVSTQNAMSTEALRVCRIIGRPPSFRSSREEDLFRTATRTDEEILLPALGTPDGLFTQPTRTFESVAQISAASTRADGRGTLLAEPDIRRGETLEVHERPASIDPKGRPRVHTSHPLPGITESSHERSAPRPAWAIRSPDPPAAAPTAESSARVPSRS